MCSSCGAKAALRLPGGTPGTPLIFGEANGQAARTATLQESYGSRLAGAHVFVSGDGVEQAVADGVIVLGVAPTRRSIQRDQPFVVTIGADRAYQFRTRAAAERYARRIGGTVLTRDEWIARGESA